MHLTPEQIDRQPFRMTRRGYDIVQVRNFLREIAGEMRARQEVRERLAENGEETAVVEHDAHQILDDARERAAQLVSEAESKVDAADDLNDAETRATAIVAAAEAEAASLIDAAEASARERSDTVLSAAQARLDQLLEEERSVHERVDAARAELGAPADAPALVDARDVVAVDLAPDSSLADFMKSTLRDEVRPD